MSSSLFRTVKLEIMLLSNWRPFCSNKLIIGSISSIEEWFKLLIIALVRFAFSGFVVLTSFNTSLIFCSSNFSITSIYKLCASGLFNFAISSKYFVAISGFKLSIFGNTVSFDAKPRILSAIVWFFGVTPFIKSGNWRNLTFRFIRACLVNS